MDEISYYAFRNKRTGKLISGTDYRYDPPHQISSNEWRPPLLISKAHPLLLLAQIEARKINSNRYETIEIVVKTIEK